MLPKLLRTGRTHSANTPIPDGWVPCGNLHPQNSVIDRLGADKTPNPAAHAAFQALLRQWGHADYLAAKALFNDALAAAPGPEDTAEPGSRLGRVGLRNAIRQARRFQPDSPVIHAWAAVFDKGSEVDPDEDPQSKGH